MSGSGTQAQIVLQLQKLEGYVMAGNYRDAAAMFTFGGQGGTLGALLDAWYAARTSDSPKLDAGYGSYR